MKKIIFSGIFLFAFALSGKNIPDSSGLELFTMNKSKLLSKRLYLSGSFGQNNSTSVGALYSFRKKSDGKLNFYIGARATYKRFNISEYFLSAPAELSRGTTGWEAVTANRQPATIDTLTFNAGSNLAINLSVHASYRLAKVLGMRLAAEVNADLLGMSMGPTISGTYSHNGQLWTTQAKPSSMNMFLLGDNNKGSLNSEFLLRFGPDKISVHAGFGVSMWEHTTNTAIQKEGEVYNDRFRMRSTTFVVGGRYRF